MKKPLSQPSPRPASGKEAVILAAILLLAFSLRFIFFLQLNRSPVGEMLIEDSRTYHDWAAAIAGGDWVGNEVFAALPLYPYLLGLIYVVFGVSVPAARLVQVLLGTINCGLIYLLGRRLFSPAAGLLAAFFTAVYGWLIVYDSTILSPVAIVFFVAFLLLFLLRLREREAKWPGWLVAGVLAGLTAMVSGHSLLFILMAGVWIFLPRRRYGAALVFLAGAAAVLGLVTYRNWRVGDDFVPLTAHGGINFFIGNNPYARGVFEPPPILRSGGATLQRDAETIARRALGRPLQPSEVSSFWFRQGFDFIRENPGRFLRLLARKFTIFWDQLEIADVIHPTFLQRWTPILQIPFPVFGVVAPLCLLGLLLAAPRWRKLLPLYLFIAGYIFSTVLYFVNSRYRLPLVPFLMIFAAYSLLWGIERVRRGQWKGLALALAALTGLVLWVNPQLAGEPRFILNLGAGHNHLGTYFSQQGDLDRAKEEFAQALRLEPQRPEAHYNLANIFFRLGELDKAELGYREAIRRNPAYESAHLALGLIHERRGEAAAAEGKYREVIQNLPFSPRPYLNLARLLLIADRPQEAVGILNQGLERAEGMWEFYLYLGLAHSRSGNSAAAAAALEKGVETAPRALPLRLELGRILSTDPLSRDRARGHLEEALRLDPASYAGHLYLGDLYYRSGMAAEAERSWRAAREINPGGEEARQRLQAVGERLKPSAHPER
jgi:tetratricopeptide (TPR) repeat protein